MTGLSVDLIDTSTEFLFDEDNVAASDEIEDLDEAQRKFENPDEGQLTETISQASDIFSQGLSAFSDLKQDLRRFVYPNASSYIREVLLRFLLATNLTPIYSVTVRVNWELQSFLAKEYSPQDDIGQILTVTGEIPWAQSSSCEDYMRQIWPESGYNTLLALSRVLQTGSSCKYSTSGTLSK